MTIYLDIDGTPVPSTEVVWFHVAPCGCLSGAQTADSSRHGFPDYSPILTAAQAAAVLYEGEAVQRKRDEAAGFTFRADTFTNYRAMDKDALMRCPHTPEWGVPARPKPDGYRWAATGHDARALHLVPWTYGDDIERTPWEDLRQDKRVTTLCQRVTRVSWSIEWHVIDRKPDCLPCTKAANALLGAPLAPAVDGMLV